MTRATRTAEYTGATTLCLYLAFELGEPRVEARVHDRARGSCVGASGGEYTKTLFGDMAEAILVGGGIESVGLGCPAGFTATTSTDRTPVSAGRHPSLGSRGATTS